MNEKEYLAQRDAITIVGDYILYLENTLDNLGAKYGGEYYTEAEANEARDALAEITG